MQVITSILDILPFLPSRPEFHVHHGVTWGDPGSGGDSSEVKEKLQKVWQIEATERAFAAILSDGSLIAWGDPMRGGEFEVEVRIRMRMIDMDTALSKMCG